MLRHLHLAVLFAFMALALAIDLPAGFLEPRQNSPVVSGATSSSAAAATTTAAPTTTQQPTTTQPQTTVQTTLAQTTTPAPTTTTAAPATSSAVVAPSSSSAEQVQSSSASVPPSSEQTSILSIPASSSTATDISSDTTTSSPTNVVVTSTDAPPSSLESLTTVTYTSNGRLVSSVATGTRTQVPTSTSKPGLASGYGNESNTLSAQSKKLIGGIVGGIGGAFLLAGIAFVIYKMWGRKKHEQVSQEDDYFTAAGAMSAGSSDSLGKEKRSGWGPSSLTSKFSEPLDRYRSPSTTVTSPVANSWGGRSPNAASNF